MPPMVLSDVDFYKDKIMEDEVFGPFLSIVPMKGTSDEWIKEAINMVQSKPKPLVCYIFSERQKFINQIKEKISGGTIVVNDTVMQMSLDDVPFGGIGESGCGHYGGRSSFLSFSHEKPIAQRVFGYEATMADRYPNGRVERLIPALNRIIPRPKSKARRATEIGVGILVTGIAAHIALKKFAKIDVFEKLRGSQ